MRFLLERDDRENLEREFKKSKDKQKPWDPNLLSCTPTLEMGIDIGDLSTVILSSIPPAQANYAQRAGRGGRKDGNALTVAIANARPHDLYFYQDPMEMIAGAVEPPKVFLKASAVLARQFTAYCMDCWVKSGTAVVPDKVSQCLAKLDETSKDRFPNNLLYYVQNNMARLVRMFIQTFSVNPGKQDGLDENSIKDIKTFAMGEGTTNSPMHIKIYNEFYDLKKQRDGIQSSIKELTNSLIYTRRCSEEICSFIRDKLGIQIQSARINAGTVIRPSNIQEILDDKNIVKLVYDNASHYSFRAVNWSYSKGDTYDAVCVILNGSTEKLVEDKFSVSTLKTVTLNKLYVALTRSKGDLYIVTQDEFETVKEKYYKIGE